MRTAEESSFTVLHRLIQEQLRYGNPTDTRTLLAIQEQALRGGSGGGGGGGGGTGSSLESLSPDDPQFLHMSTRQEPQGQEHQVDFSREHRESPACQLYQLHEEELPTYEEAKAHSQYLATVGTRRGPAQLGLGAVEAEGHQGGADGQWDLKREHARSLSERLMQLSLERNGVSHGPRNGLPLSSSHSDPQLSCGPADHPGQLTDERGPPPDYPFLVRPPGYMVSHSQETQGQYYQEAPSPFHSQHHRYVAAQAEAKMVPHGVQAGSEVYMAAVRSGNHNNSNNTAQVDTLMKENQRLRRELEGYGEKTARLQKLELEIHRISEAYEMLMKGSAKRETLEKTMRNKLESEIKRLHDFNRDLRGRLDTATKQRVAKEVESADQKQHVFARLLEQNEEQQKERECLEREVQRLRSSGEEWLWRREVLEQALGSAQARNLVLEEELRRKRAYVEKVERLQSALGQLQAACEKREGLELRLRTRLEQELKSLRAQQWQSHSVASGPGSLASDLSSVASIRQQLAEKEERVLALEADITRWEQKYLEESTMRQFAMDAAAAAAAQRDTTLIRHSPRQSPNASFHHDPPSSAHRHQEMENRIRVLHSQLLEKDAVIRLLQQRSRREQNRLEQQALRPARSVPIISTAASAQGPVERPVRGKGKSLSDDQTAAPVSPLCTAPQPHPRALPLSLPVSKPQGRDFSSQCDRDGPARETDLTAENVQATSTTSTQTSSSETPEPTQVPLSTYKSLSSPAAEVVEILI
ncbi:angiomotin-like 2a [Esox lucius]|uniref:Angiomotin C-terminal domain-containing protein n=1 Tax=Esox lucius TaxID=8010 RepID=A0A3P8XRQ9_ESOLU|nr:angiomotin-like 2a [Esox lucius]